MSIISGKVLLGIASLIVAGACSWPATTAAATLTSDSSHRLKDSAIIQRDGVWHVFSIYDCRPHIPNCTQMSQGFRHYHSTDLHNWVDDGLVVPPRGTGWESYQVWAPSVVEHNGVYTMFYTGVQRNLQGTYVQGIGYATSTDLMTWERVPDNQLWDCSQVSWAYWNPANPGDGAACRDPHVRWDEATNRWTMVYSTRWPDAGNQAPWITNPMVIGLATSDDLLNWTDAGAMLETRWYVAESAFLLARPNGYALVWTDNCGRGACLQFATAGTLAGPFQRVGPVSSYQPNFFGAEFFSDGQQDFSLAVEGYWLTAAVATWPNGQLTLAPFLPMNIHGSTWVDENRDGSFAAPEVKLSNMPLRLYRDSGDGVFDPQSDTWYASTTSQANGTYQFPSLLSGQYWLTTDLTAMPVDRAGFVPAAAAIGPIQAVYGQSQTFDQAWVPTASQGASQAPPTLLAPIQSQPTGTFRPTFQFTVDPSGSATHIQLQISSSAGFTGTETMNFSTLQSCSGWSPCPVNGAPAERSFRPPQNLVPAHSWWRVRTIDAGQFGNWSGWSTPQQFTLPPPVAITNAQATVTSTSSLRVTWQTNVPAMSMLYLASDEDELSLYGQALSQNHLFDAIGLEPGRLYYLWVTSWTEPGVADWESLPSVTLPLMPVEMSLVGVTPSTRSAVLNWSTNVPTTAVVEYGLTPAYGQQVTVPQMTTDHQVTLSNLEPSRLYFFRVRVTNVLTVETDGLLFHTTDEEVIQPPDYEILPIFRRAWHRWRE